MKILEKMHFHPIKKKKIEKKSKKLIRKKLISTNVKFCF